MSEQSNDHPTQEQIRAVRREGFADSVGHMPEEKRNNLTQSYHTQDSRREANVSGFYASVQGGGE